MVTITLNFSLFLHKALYCVCVVCWLLMTTELDAYGIDSLEVLNRKDAVLNACTVLNKRSRKFEHNIKIGVREQIDNLLSYINEGSSIDDIVFFTMNEKNTAIEMIQRFENADPKFARKIKGRLLVMSKVEEILK